MPEYGIWLLALYGRPIEEWAESYDPDAGEGPVSGWVNATRDLAKAMRFPSMVEATACWQQQSKRVPLRPDGRPNKPLTAFTVEIRALSVAEESG